MAVLDPTILDQLASQIGAPELRSVTLAFRDDLAQIGAQLAAAASEAERRSVAHALAGAAANCGALRLAEGARAVMLGGGDPERVQALLGEALAALDARLA
jgi:HPt (histidine-containing phosphotransfer) domain-containing protein